MITLRELKEKAVSKQQQKLMGLALSYKRGETSDAEVSDTVRDLSKSMSTKELEDFASTKHKGLPQKKEDNEISNRSAALKPQTYNDPKTGKKKVRMVPVNTNIVKTKDDVKEEMDPTKHVSKKGNMYCVYNKAGKEVAKFDDEKKANAYARKNHDKLMEYLEIGTDKIRTTYAAVTPGQTNGGVNEFATSTDRAIAVGAVGGAAYAAKKVKDRFNPVKVAKARSDRDEKKKERDKAERELSQRRDYQKKLRDMRNRQKKQRNKK